MFYSYRLYNHPAQIILYCADIRYDRVVIGFIGNTLY